MVVFFHVLLKNSVLALTFLFEDSMLKYTLLKHIFGIKILFNTFQHY